MKRVSIKDIANRAGVAPSTVSLVMNGKAKERRISTELAKDIRKLAKEMGYAPDQTAVSLRTGKTKTFGLIVGNIANIFFATMAKAIEDRAYSRGYRVIYGNTNNNDEKGNQLIHLFLNQNVDGFLIAPSKGMQTQIEELIEDGKAVVLLDRYFPGVEIPSVTVDNYGGVQKGMERLIEKGYRRIAFISLDLDQSQMRDREKGFEETLKRHQLSFQRGSLLRVPPGQSKNKSVEQITSFIKARKPEAVVFATNFLAVYGLESIGNLGLSIPKDIAVISFDDHDIFRIYKPGITAIEQPIEDIARTAVDILVNKLGGVDLPNATVVKETRLISRHSI